MKRRRNMDDDLRRLERAARAGVDPNADAAFRRALARAGARYPLDMIDPAKLWLLARMNTPERGRIIAILGEEPPVARDWERNHESAHSFAAYSFASLVGADVHDEVSDGKPLPGHRLRTRLEAIEVVRQAIRDLVSAQAPGAAEWEGSDRLLSQEIESLLAKVPDDQILTALPSLPDTRARRRSPARRIVREFSGVVASAEGHLLVSLDLLENSAAFVEYVPITARMVDRATTHEESVDEVDWDLLSSLALDDAAALGFSQQPEEVIATEFSDGKIWAEGRFSRSAINDMTMRFVVERLTAWLREDAPMSPPPRNAPPRRARSNPDLPCRIVSLTDHSPELRPQARSLFSKAKIRYDDNEELFEACVAPDGRVVGASVVGLYDETPDDGDDLRRPRWTFSVAVAEDYRRKGIARALVRSIMAAHPRETVMLEGKVVNPFMADLLKSLGFYFYDTEEAEDEWTDHQRSWGRRMYLPNPACWDRLPERERVRLMTQATKEEGAIRRRRFPTTARLGADGERVRVLGIAADLSGRVDNTASSANMLVVRPLEGPDAGNTVIVPASSIYEDGRPWMRPLPECCPKSRAWTQVPARRRNADADIRALERAAAAGDRDAAVQLDLERHRHGLHSVFGSLVDSGLTADLARGPDYVPTPGVLANREQGRQEALIDEIGRRVLGEQYYSFSSGEDGWDRGYRHLHAGGVETRLDGPFSRHVSYRDNRDHGLWLGRMEELANAFEDAGYKVYWVERAGAVRGAFVPLDADRIQLARALGEEYASALRVARSRR